MIVINDFENVDEEELKNKLSKIAELSSFAGLDVTFSDIVKTPIYLSLTEIFDITTLALKLIMSDVYIKNSGNFDLAHKVYKIFAPYQTQLSMLEDKIEGNE